MGLERGGWSCSSVGWDWEWGRRGHLHGVDTKAIPEREKKMDTQKEDVEHQFGFGLFGLFGVDLDCGEDEAQPLTTQINLTQINRNKLS